MSQTVPAALAILVHGAWQGAWVWERFAPLLCLQGYAVEAIDLPGSRGERTGVTFEEQVAALVRRIDAASGPVVLIAHSGGAVVAAQAAERRAGRLAGLVLVAGIMLPSGVSLADVIETLVSHGHEPRQLAGIRPFLQWSADRTHSTVPASAAADIFLHDCDRETVAFAASRLVPQSERARAGLPELSPSAYGRVPRLYVEALQDRSIVLAVQRQLQQLSPGAEVVSLDSGHVPQLSQPEALAECLREPLARWVGAAMARALH